MIKCFWQCLFKLYTFLSLMLVQCNIWFIFCFSSVLFNRNLLQGESRRIYNVLFLNWYTGWPKKNGTVDTVDFSGLCSDQQLSFFTLLDRASFLQYIYNNTKTIKIGWELFILWVISYGLPFSGFARFPEFRGTINDSFSSKYMRQQSTHVFFNQLHVQRISVPMTCLDWNPC